MQQKRNDPRRTGQPSSARPRGSAPRPRKNKNNARRAYDQAKDRRPSGQNRRPRLQGYQEQVLDFSGGNIRMESRTPRPDNSIQFPQQAARRSAEPQRSQNRQGQQNARPAGQRQRTNNTTMYPGPRPRNGQQRPQQNQRQAASGRYRPAQADSRSPARREGKKKRRLTRAGMRRRRAMRRLTALGLLVCVIAVGVYLTVTMLFKINTLQVVSDGAVVDSVGGYSSAEILQALGVQAEENIFSFDPAQKAAELEREFPLLENIQVVRDYPNTVVVRANAAEPVYAMQISGGWLSLSAGLKILSRDSAQPQLLVLYGGDPVSETPGVQLEFELPAQQESSSGSASSDSAASSETAAPEDKRLESLNTLLAALESSGLKQDVTRIEFEDPEEMAFLYQGRISVLLGTLNELDYKLRLAKYVLLNEDGKGCSATDTGMLDLSHLSASSSRKFRFAQGDPTLPSGYVAAEPAEAPAESEADSQTEADTAAEQTPETTTDAEGADAAPAEENTAAAAEQQ